MEKTSYTIEQLEGVQAATKKLFTDLSETLGRIPTFREVMEYQYKYTVNKESSKTLFPHMIKGWELNNYPMEDYQSVYDDIYDPTRAKTYVQSEVIPNLSNKKPPISHESSYLTQEENLEKSEKTTFEIKNYKTIFGDSLAIIGGGSFFLAMFGFIGYISYKSFVAESSQYQSLLLGAILISILSSVILISDIKGPKGHLFDVVRENKITSLIVVPLIILAIVPLFTILVNIIILILSFWYYLISIFLVITLFFVWFSKMNNLKKILITVLIILSIYFFFGSKDIIRFDFQTYYDGEKLF